MKKLFILPLALLLFSCRQSSVDDLMQSVTWVDLSHEFDSNTVHWPTNQKFHHDTVTCGITAKGYFYSSFRYGAEEHVGTHFDAPLHFRQGGEGVDKVGIDRLHGPAVVIDVTRQAEQNRDYQVSVADFKKWEELHGKIPAGSIILLNTGWGKYWNDHLKYTGTLKTGAEGVKELHFPGLDPAAAAWLASSGKVIAVGLDTPSIDNGPSTEFMSHRTLCGSGITIYENVANLDKLPSHGAYAVALPMKIKGGSGAPLRIVAGF